MAKHPDNAAYVSADGLVSFDRYGRKLDSIGNVVAGDRQRAGDAGAQPIQRREESRSQQQEGSPVVARYTFPANATGQPVQRSTWDNSPISPQAGAAIVGPRMGNNPNVLAPNGIDEGFLGLPYPTARNGLLGSQWARPWTGRTQQAQAQSWRGYPADSADNFDTSMGGGAAMPQAPSRSAAIPMQTGGLDVRPQQMRSYVPPSMETPSIFPNPPRYDSYDNMYLPDPWVGAGQQAQGSYLRIPNVYQPETYTRPLDVYDPNQLSWMVP